MARFDKTIKPSAAVPRRKSSLGRRDKSNSSIHETIRLHPTRHLIVTTTKGVFTWGNQGVQEIFTSGSGGIVAARRVKNGSSLLAVADSQVVVLHDTRKGMQKSYKLRGSDVGQFSIRTEKILLINSGPSSPSSLCWGFQKTFLHHHSSERCANLLFEGIKTSRSFL